jgi:hypothetical protein
LLRLSRRRSVLRGHPQQPVDLTVFDIVDKAVHILGQYLGIAYQRGGACIVSARDCLSCLALEAPCVIRQLPDIFVRLTRCFRSHERHCNSKQGGSTSLNQTYQSICLRPTLR